jgi:hypothetical protein
LCRCERRSASSRRNATNAAFQTPQSVVIGQTTS